MPTSGFSVTSLGIVALLDRRAFAAATAVFLGSLLRATPPPSHCQAAGFNLLHCGKVDQFLGLVGCGIPSPNPLPELSAAATRRSVPIDAIEECHSGVGYAGHLAIEVLDASRLFGGALR